MEDKSILRSQIGTANKMSRSLPYVFSTTALGGNTASTVLPEKSIARNPCKSSNFFFHWTLPMLISEQD